MNMMFSLKPVRSHPFPLLVLSTKFIFSAQVKYKCSQTKTWVSMVNLRILDKNKEFAIWSECLGLGAIFIFKITIGPKGPSGRSCTKIRVQFEQIIRLVLQVCKNFQSSSPLHAIAMLYLIVASRSNEQLKLVHDLPDRLTHSFIYNILIYYLFWKRRNNLLDILYSWAFFWGGVKF